MRKLGVEELLILAVMSGAKTVVRTVYGNSNGFGVKVGMHQGSALSPLLFLIIMEALSREFRVALPGELLHADDLVVIAETEDDLIKMLNEWKGTHSQIQPFYGSIDIISVLQQNRLRWYGHVLRKEDNDCVKKCMKCEVDGVTPRGRPKKTWREIVAKDCQALKLNTEYTMDCNRWRKQVRDD